MTGSKSWMRVLIMTGVGAIAAAGVLIAGGAGEDAGATAEANRSTGTEGGMSQPAGPGESPDLTEPVGSEPGIYIPYDEALFADAVDRRRVYFFHASWCSSCRAADSALRSNRELIPSDVVVFRTDYDANRELKQRYAVTYQHTFVLVDAAGNALRTWSGGDIDLLLENTRGET